MVIVSAVIPTRGRPELLQRAVRSALAQTLRAIEVVVVIDGEDPATSLALKEWTHQDGRLRVLALPASVGGSDARNRGVEAASGEWIAFLDDDDEWLPGKLQAQLDAVGTIDCAGLDRHLQDDRAHPGQRLCVAAAHAGQQ